MKTLQTTFPALYTKWVNTGWTLLTGRPPEPPATQKWEDEGGSIKPQEKPGTEPVPKIPL
jgi:hypothetical protein